MANVDAAFGFVPVRQMSGNAPRANKYTIASGLAENIFKGDLVILISHWFTYSAHRNRNQ